MSLFTASMLGLVLADNLLFLFVFWEGVGLCSYLLIGFWFHRPAAARAATKAFLVTRLGDFGFLAAILFLYFKTGTFDIGELQSLALMGAIGGTALTWAAIGVFSGAVGKSAQFPLHTWLPDAMEGPTPVSALIHAATMVAAGVYLVARMFPVFASSIEAVTTVAVIGGFTAIFAATMGLVMNDIKRVLAYSTISQLGYMMLGLGVVGIGVANDAIANVAFDATRQYSFVVEGQFDLYGGGRPSLLGTNEVKRLVKKFGGEVADQLTPQTDFVIMGTAPPLPGKPKDEAEDSEKVVYEEQMKIYNKYRDVRDNAVRMRIPVLNTHRFLGLVGYTPARTLR